MRRMGLFQGLPPFSPEPKERIIWKGKPVLRSFWFLFLAGILAAACSGIGLAAWPSRAALVLFGSALAFCAAMFALAGALRRAYDFILTDRRVRVEFRFLVTRAPQAHLRMVTNVATFQDLVGRVFGFGTVRIDTPATPFGAIAFQGIRDFTAVQDMIWQAVEASGFPKKEEL